MNMIAGWMLFLAPFAQEGQEDRGIERAVGRMKESLSLTDEQAAQVREVLLQGRKDQEEKIRGLLTEEQSGKFTGLASALRGGGGRDGEGGGRGRRGFGDFFGRFNAPNLDELRKELNLTDEQFEKVKKLVDEFSENLRQKFNELRENGFQGFNFQEAMEEAREKAKELADKIREHLTDEQKPKFDAKVEELLRSGPFSGGGFGPRGVPTPPGGEGGDRPGRRFSAEDRTKRAMDRLKIENAEESATVRALVEKVAKAQEAAAEFGRSSRERLREAAEKKDVPEAEAEKLLEEIRTERNRLESAVREARKELREIVSFLQELVLVEAGLLE